MVVLPLHARSNFIFFGGLFISKAKNCISIYVIYKAISFQSIKPTSGNLTWEHSQNPANQHKNRYNNIVACELCLIHIPRVWYLSQMVSFQLHHYVIPSSFFLNKPVVNLSVILARCTSSDEAYLYQTQGKIH